LVCGPCHHLYLVRSVGEVSKDRETFEARAALAADARSV
jgi:hypothetical protein